MINRKFYITKETIINCLKLTKRIIMRNQPESGKIKQILKKSKEYPSFFAKSFLIGKDGRPLNLEPQQRYFVDDKTPFRVFFASRRSGKSVALSVDILHKLFFNTDFNIIVLAPSLKQSKEFANVFGDLIDRSPMIRSSVTVDNKMEKKLANRSRVSFFTAGGSSGKKEDSSVVGSSPDVLYADELQSIGDETLGTILPAAVGQRKQMQIIYAGTPRQRSGTFYEAVSNAKYITEWYNDKFMQVQNPSGRFSLHQFKITETDEDGNVLLSRSPRVSIEDLETIKESIGLQKFQREFELEFLDASTIVYYQGLIEKQGILDPPKTFFSRQIAVGGIDIGKQRNNTVLTIALMQKPDLWNIQHYKSWELGTRYKDILHYLKNVLPTKFPNFKYLSIDKTGVGNAIYEDMEGFKKYVVDGVIFSQPSKITLAEGAVANLESGLLRFYPHKVLLREMDGYNRTETEQGRIVYEKGISDDFIDSFNLCNYSINQVLNQRMLFGTNKNIVSSLGRKTFGSNRTQTRDTPYTMKNSRQNRGRYSWQRN